MSILTGGHTGAGSASNNPWAAPNANSASSLTWYYYHETKTFAPGPKLLLGRRYHGSATIVDQVTKAKIPIVTAGYHHTFLSSTELLINRKWQAGTVKVNLEFSFSFLGQHPNTYSGFKLEIHFIFQFQF